MMRYKLKEIFDLQMGKTPARNNQDYWNTDDNKWISIADLSKTGKYISDTKECLSDSAVKESKIKIIPANTVVMSFKLSIGKTAITAEDMYSNEAIMAFHDKHVVEILPEYIFYMFKYKDWDEGSNKAVMGKTLNKATLSEVEVEICSIERQREIIAVLDKMTDLLSGREKELQLLDELVKARFVELFGDPISNPKGWNMVELGELTSIGSSKRIFEKEYVSDGIPFYRTKEIVELSKGNSISTELYITEERFAEIKEKYGVPKTGDLLISAVGTIGVIWIVDGENDFYFKDGNLIRVDGSEKFDSIYMKNLLEHLIDEYKKQMSSGTAYAALTISGLTKMKVYDVPMELQRQFSEFYKQVDKSKVAVQKALDETQLLFDSLMQEYFG